MRRQFHSAALAAVACAGWQAGCGKLFSQSSEGVATVVAAGDRAVPKAEPADVVLRHVAFLRFADGRVVARGTAAEASYRQVAGKVEASVLEVLLAQSPQAPSDLGALAIRAPLASGDLPARTGTGWGGVRVRAERGDEAFTERVLIDGPRDLVQAPQPVTVAGPGYTLRGDSMVARGDGSRVQLTGGVAGRLSPAASPLPGKRAPAKASRQRRK